MKRIKPKIQAILLVILASFLFTLAQFFYKAASRDFSFSFRGTILNYYIWTALLMYGIGTLIFTYALKKEELSVLYPIVSTSFIWVTLFSYLFLGEALTLFKIVGISSIMLGIIVLSSCKGEDSLEKAIKTKKKE